MFPGMNAANKGHSVNMCYNNKQGLKDGCEGLSVSICYNNKHSLTTACEGLYCSYILKVDQNGLLGGNTSSILAVKFWALNNIQLKRVCYALTLWNRQVSIKSCTRVWASAYACQMEHNKKQEMEVL